MVTTDEEETTEREGCDVKGTLKNKERNRENKERERERESGRNG